VVVTETTVAEIAETEENINVFFLKYKRDQRKLIPFFVSGLSRPEIAIHKKVSYG
jgi:hypothetical protein